MVVDNLLRLFRHYAKKYKTLLLLWNLVMLGAHSYIYQTIQEQSVAGGK